MPANLISHPFRVAHDGTIATVTQDTDDQLREQIIIAIRTQPGERELVPSFGVIDPTFGRFQQELLVTQLAKFGPNVAIVKTDIHATDDTTSAVTVHFDAGNE